jgi:hypothetical protein
MSASGHSLTHFLVTVLFVECLDTRHLLVRNSSCGKKVRVETGSGVALAPMCSSFFACVLNTLEYAAHPFSTRQRRPSFSIDDWNRKEMLLLLSSGTCDEYLFGFRVFEHQTHSSTRCAVIHLRHSATVHYSSRGSPHVMAYWHRLPYS